MPKLYSKTGQEVKYLPKDNRFHGQKIYVSEPYVYNDRQGDWIFVRVGKIGPTAIVYLTDIEDV